MRYYDLDKLMDTKNPEHNLTIAYARVSSHDQKEDLKRQAEALAAYCAKQDWGFGMNYRKKGLKRF